MSIYFSDLIGLLPQMEVNIVFFLNSDLLVILRYAFFNVIRAVNLHILCAFTSYSFELFIS